MPPKEQFEALRKMKSSGSALWLKYGLTLLTLGFAIAFLVYGHPAYAAVLAFVALVTYSAWQATPHILYAGEAMELANTSQGTVQIGITNWSDSNTYHATVSVAPSERWRFEFIPLGWQPSEGEFNAIFFAHPSVKWPVLVQVEQGIFFPRYNPKRVAT